MQKSELMSLKDAVVKTEEKHWKVLNYPEESQRENNV